MPFEAANLMDLMVCTGSSVAETVILAQRSSANGLNGVAVAVGRGSSSIAMLSKDRCVPPHAGAGSIPGDSGL